MTKFLKIMLIIVLSIITAVCALFFSYLVITKDAVLDHEKLSKPGQNIIIYDDEGNEIAGTSTVNKHKNVKVEDLDETCINAFIASEDRKFYSHNGLNYGRMIKAFFKNIAARSFKEGASTISQQLIKNTHLSHDKTIKRKLYEIRLTKQLERAYSKDEILEMYLNTIYFGHSCYGLQSAAEFYFGKKAENLSLNESATLVGLLSSPNNYSPFKNPEKSIQKRNTVLKAMLECGFIDENTYKTETSQPINTVEQAKNSKYSDYINAIFDEIGNLDLNQYNVAYGCKVKTYLCPEMQNFIENIEYKTDNAIIITNIKGQVNAYKSTIANAKRQPGSTVKPIFVYAPAIEEKLLSSFTRILDEKINFNGYSPENFDKKYHGYTSVADSIKYSYNIPAVKTLNSLTIKNAEKYFTKMNISLEEDDKNLSLALGGMKYGLSLKEICDCYATFGNAGIYTPSRFIKEIITADGVTIYKNEQSESRVFSEGTCSIMNEILIDTAKQGTAKKLKSLPFCIAAKTGTCGTEDGNTDAYSIGYTSKHCVGVWLGDKDNKKTDITGGNNCTSYLKEIFQKLYSNSLPKKLETDLGTTPIQIDADEYYSNNKIMLADDVAPKLNKLSVKILKGCEPKEKSTTFSSPSIKIPQIKVDNEGISILLYQTKYYAYIVKRYKNDHFDIIYDGKWQKSIQDKPNSGSYTYTVTPYYTDGKIKKIGKEITLPNVNFNCDSSSPQVKIPDIADKDWYNL